MLSFFNRLQKIQFQILVLKTISEYGSMTYTKFQKNKIIKDLKEFSNLEKFLKIFIYFSEILCYDNIIQNQERNTK